MLDYNNPDRFEDAVDSRGILKDGKAVRVPTFLRDATDTSLTSLQRFTRCPLHSDAELASHRPGFRYGSAYSSANRQALYDAYDAEIAHVADWLRRYGV